MTRSVYEFEPPITYICSYSLKKADNSHIDSYRLLTNIALTNISLT